MIRELLPSLLIAAGIGQLGVLCAAAIVPFQLDWRRELSPLSKLHRQMYLVYGGYIVLTIIAFASISLLNASELASGSGLARAFCTYVAIFWGIRLVLQAVFDVKEHLTAWWLTAGYHLLTVLFVALTAIYAIAAFAL